MSDAQTECFVCGKSITDRMSLRTFCEQKTLSKESRLRSYHADCFSRMLAGMKQDELVDFVKHNAIYFA